MMLNSDGHVGCLGVAKALQIGGSPKSGCTQALAYRLYDFLLGVSHRQRQLWCPNSLESLDSRRIHLLVATCKQKRRRRWCSIAPLMVKSVFFLKDSELGAIVFGFRISYLFFGVIHFSFMEGGKRIRLFRIADDFFP